MRPIVKIWCLPENAGKEDKKEGQKKLKELFDKIVEAFILYKNFEVESEKDLLILFPMDHMEYGLGTEILVEVESNIVQGDLGLSKVNEHDYIASELFHILRQFFPDAVVECNVYHADSKTIRRSNWKPKPEEVS